MISPIFNRSASAVHKSSEIKQQIIMWSPVFTLALVAQALAFEPINTHYHRTIGIPEASRIKAAEENISRIIGGAPAQLGDNPHLAGLLVTLQTDETSVCGATLLTKARLVTAAHCWNDGEYYGILLEVILGSVTLFNGGTRMITSTVESHANFQPSTLQNDIAVISIPPIEYTDIIQPATLPSGFLLFLTFEYSNARAAGFGRTSDSSPITIAQTARHVTLEVMPNLECQALYGFNIIDTHLCTYGIRGNAICGGDSGGPLTITIGGETILIGVTAFSPGSGCQSGYPSGFTRVTEFVNWINARL